MDREESFTESQRIQELVESAKSYKIENQPQIGEISKSDFIKRTGMTKNEADRYLKELEKQGKIRLRTSPNGQYLYISVI